MREIKNVGGNAGISHPQTAESQKIPLFQLVQLRLITSPNVQKCMNMPCMTRVDLCDVPASARDLSCIALLLFAVDILCYNGVLKY